MKFNDFKWARGYVNCSLKGKYIELFINMAIKNKLEIWNFRVAEADLANFSISLTDFFKLKPILRKTYTRIHVLERIGLPFFLNKLGKRKGIILGLLFFIILIYSFSSMILVIDIKGNETIKDEVIYRALNELGIHKGMFKFQMDEPKVLQGKLLETIDGTAWIGIKVNGTHLYITVVEKVKPKEKPLLSPRHIVSKKEAVIYKILAEKGLPQVKVNDHVKKGDILISGIMGDEELHEVVVAKGIVEGIVWYKADITVPVKQTWREFTGDILERKYIYIGQRMIKIQGEKDIPFKTYKKNYNYKQISWRDYHLPIGIIDEKNLKYEKKERLLSYDEAFKLGINIAKSELFSKINENSHVISEKVLHQANENGKVSIRMLFEVIEDITTTQPIIQGE